VLGRVVERAGGAEEAGHDDSHQAQDSDDSADRAWPGCASNGRQQRNGAARIACRLRPRLVSREQDDQDEGEKDDPGRREEIEVERHTQVEALAKAVEVDMGCGDHGLTVRWPSSCPVDSHSIRQSQVLSALKVWLTVSPDFAANVM